LDAVDTVIGFPVNSNRRQDEANWSAQVVGSAGLSRKPVRKFVVALRTIIGVEGNKHNFVAGAVIAIPRANERRQRHQGAIFGNVLAIKPESQGS